MSALKPPGVRNKKYSYKGFKVKHVVQVFVLLALCTWLLNQARRSYEHRKPSAIVDGLETRMPLDSEDRGVIKLGRKDLDDPHQVETPTLENVDAGEDVEADEEVEENRNVEIDLEKAEEETEEAEDLIDEDDRD